MLRLATGDLQLDANEQVSVTVTAAFAPFAATFSSPNGATWIGPAQVDDLTETNAFVGPSSSGSQVTLSMIFDFVPDSTGAYPPGSNYSVVIQGESGPPVQDDVVPPPITGLTFTFVTA